MALKAEQKGEDYRKNAWMAHMELIRGITLIAVMTLAIFSSPQLSAGVPLRESLILFAVCIVYYGFAFRLLYRIALKRRVLIRFFKHFQSVFNLLLISALVHFTGGINSFYTFLFVLEVLVSNFLMPQEDCYLEASLAWMTYFLLLLLESLGVLPHVPEPISAYRFWDMEAILFSVFQLLIVLYGITWLGGYLHIFLQFRGRELEKMVETLEDQNLSLTEMSITDSLTGLYNRRYFFQRLLEEIKRAERYHHPMSLIMADIDHFKKINDSHGHPCGDTILREFSELFKNSGRAVDVAARYGGEEFALILPETSSDDAKALAERLCLRIAEHPFPGPGGEFELMLTASLGLASYPTEAATPEELIEKADSALYRAKQQGRNRVCLSGEKTHSAT
ncbi:MAG: GGDEF domain-containing protein [bacterium]